MARFLSSAKRPLLPLLRSCTPSSFRPFVADACSSSTDDDLLRLLRAEATHLSSHCPLRPPPQRFGSFVIEDRPGEQWIRLRSNRRSGEDVKVDATMLAERARPVSSVHGPHRHISLVVEVSKGDDSDAVLEFICSAWQDALEVQEVFPLRRRGTAVQPFTGRDFKKLEKSKQKEVIEYLEEREVDGELAEFLHEYITIKDRTECLRWLRNVESFMQL